MPVKAGKTILTDFSSFGLSEVILCGRNNNLAARSPWEKHTHDRAFEILYIAKGDQIVGASGRGYRLGGGDLFVTRPGEVHSTGIHPVNKGLFYWLQVAKIKRQRFLGLKADEGDALVRSLNDLPSPALHGGLKFKARFESIITLAGEDPATMHSLRLRQIVIDLLLAVIDSDQIPVQRQFDRGIQACLSYIDCHLEEELSASELASSVNLSVSRLRAKWKQQIGMPLNDYILRCRIDAALRRIENGAANITALSYDLGFSSSQYFSTVFKKLTTSTPSAYVDACARKGPPIHRSDKRTRGDTDV